MRRVRSTLTIIWMFIVRLVTVLRSPEDPFDPIDRARRAEVDKKIYRTARTRRARAKIFNAMSERLSKRYDKRGASTGNTQVANAFLFGGGVALIGFIGAAMFTATRKWIPVLLLPSLLLALLSLGLLIAGITFSDKGNKPTRTKDEYIEVAEQLLDGRADQEEALEDASRSIKQRYRLHVAREWGDRSLFVMKVTLAALAIEMTAYCVLNLFA